MTKTCPECGKEFQGNTKYCCRSCGAKASNRRRSQIPSPERANMRHCHDCGRPTTDYRCAACRAAWRRKHGLKPDGESFYA